MNVRLLEDEGGEVHLHGASSTVVDSAAALISLISFSMAILSAVFVLHLKGLSMDSMVIAGLVLALGLIIDDAITSVENVVKHLDQNSELNNFKSKVEIAFNAIFDRPLLRDSASWPGILALL